MSVGAANLGSPAIASVVPVETAGAAFAACIALIPLAKLLAPIPAIAPDIPAAARLPIPPSTFPFLNCLTAFAPEAVAPPAPTIVLPAADKIPPNAGFINIVIIPAKPTIEPIAANAPPNF